MFWSGVNVFPLREGRFDLGSVAFKTQTRAVLMPGV